MAFLLTYLLTLLIILLLSFGIWYTYYHYISFKYCSNSVRFSLLLFEGGDGGDITFLLFFFILLFYLLTL
ncbi:hypothetical protein DFH27DRAFT_568818 [Peziza echinospora]|nr:hypothetical protein DFH27DRAFT_568818 [Peziza echinospora]